METTIRGANAILFAAGFRARLLSDVIIESSMYSDGDTFDGGFVLSEIFENEHIAF